MPDPARLGRRGDCSICRALMVDYDKSLLSAGGGIYEPSRQVDRALG